MFFHRHKPIETGRTIFAVYGKPNLPDQAKPVESMGTEMVCECGARFIKHTIKYRLAEPITELETT